MLLFVVVVVMDFFKNESDFFITKKPIKFAPTSQSGCVEPFYQSWVVFIDQNKIQ